MEDPQERPAKIRKLSHDSPQIEAPLPAEARRNSSSEAADSPDFIVSDHSDNEGGASLATTSNPTESQDPPSSTTNPLSKNQLKKLRKRQEWEAGRDYRKLKRKQKTKEKRERRKAAKEELIANGATPDDLLLDASLNSRTWKPRSPNRLPVTFIIDCGFDELMAEKEYISLGSQLTRSYSDNSRSELQAHLAISGWGGRLRERFETVLRGHYRQWKGVSFWEEGWVEVAERAKGWMAEGEGKRMLGAFEKYVAAEQKGQGEAAVDEPALTGAEQAVPSSTDAKEEPTPAPAQPSAATPSAHGNGTSNGTRPSLTPLPPPEIIYLTADSPHTLTSLLPNSTYIIGGIVDKNRHKGICYKIARAAGVKTAKLPIGEFMEMQSRSVLATNHVVEIMLRWLECGDWGEAFERVIPKRKGGRLRDQEDGEAEAEVGGAGEDGAGEEDNGKAKDGLDVDADVTELLKKESDRSTALDGAVNAPAAGEKEQ